MSVTPIGTSKEHCGHFALDVSRDTHVCVQLIMFTQEEAIVNEGRMCCRKITHLCLEIIVDFVYMGRSHGE